MIFFINLTYEGLLHVHIRVWNPLGFDRNDFPQRRYECCERNLYAAN